MQATVIPSPGPQDPRILPLSRETSLVGLPEVFGAYTLIRRIGQGGWATVYEARASTAASPPLPMAAAGDDAEVPRATPPLPTRVALKRLERISTGAVQRMAREAQLLQAFRSERVPRLLDSGRVEGVPFLALEYVEGVDLATLLYRLRLRHQALPTEDLLELLLQIGLALRVAHTWLDPQLQRPVPIVHGDVKPSNVLISQDGRVVLTDFGSALRAGWTDVQGDDAPATAGYVAPERVQLMAPPPPAPASDLFGLGLIAFELCTLSPLFSGSPAQMLQQLLQADQFIPTALRRLPAELHPTLHAVITRLLAPRPEQRFAHIDDALRPLQALQQQLQLKSELASFVSPYLVPGPGERLEVRVTDGYLGVDEGDISRADRRLSPHFATLPTRNGAGVTHLTRAHLQALVPPPRRKLLTLADVARTQQQRQRLRLLQGGLFLLFCLCGAALLLGSLPFQVEVKSTPSGALVSLQPGCEGEWSATQLSPATLRTQGPWPVCVAVEAPGHIRTWTRVLQPALFSRTRSLSLTLDKEVCLKIGSRPPGLPVYVDNRPRGSTSLDDLQVCGLTPFEPYVVQMGYDEVRWDIREVVGKPGEEIRIFQDFSVKDVVSASPFERCSRYFSAGEYDRAIELCRVAVVEAPTFEQKLEALLIQGRSYAALEDEEAACDLFGVALDRAVDARRLELERRVIDARIALNCEAIEAARALREEAEANGSPVPEQPENPAASAAPPLPLLPPFPQPSPGAEKTSATGAPPARAPGGPGDKAPAAGGASP